MRLRSNNPSKMRDISAWLRPRPPTHSGSGQPTAVLSTPATGLSPLTGVRVPLARGPGQPAGLSTQLTAEPTPLPCGRVQPTRWLDRPAGVPGRLHDEQCRHTGAATLTIPGLGRIHGELEEKTGGLKEHTRGGGLAAHVLSQPTGDPPLHAACGGAHDAGLGRKRPFLDPLGGQLNLPTACASARSDSEYAPPCAQIATLTTAPRTSTAGPHEPRATGAFSNAAIALWTNAAASRRVTKTNCRRSCRLSIERFQPGISLSRSWTRSALSGAAGDEDDLTGDATLELMTSTSCENARTENSERTGTTERASRVATGDRIGQDGGGGSAFEGVHDAANAKPGFSEGVGKGSWILGRSWVSFSDSPRNSSPEQGTSPPVSAREFLSELVVTTNHDRARRRPPTRSRPNPRPRRRGASAGAVRPGAGRPVSRSGPDLLPRHLGHPVLRARGADSARAADLERARPRPLPRQEHREPRRRRAGKEGVRHARPPPRRPPRAPPDRYPLRPSPLRDDRGRPRPRSPTPAGRHRTRSPPLDGAPLRPPRPSHERPDQLRPGRLHHLLGAKGEPRNPRLL